MYSLSTVSGLLVGTLLLATSCTDKGKDPDPQLTGYTVSTLVGTNAGTGYVDGTGSAVRFASPQGLAADAQGNVYVADSDNHRIRRVSAAGVVSTLAGSGATGSQNGGRNGGYTDGPVAQAMFSQPHDVALDAQGTLYVADMGNYLVRKISPAGIVSTLAGSTLRGYLDGPAATAQFDMITAVAPDAQGNVYVADGGNYCIRKISPAGVVTTLAGTNQAGYADGTGSAARFQYISGLTIDAQGTLYVADLQNHRIRKVTPAGVVTTVAGSGTPGYADGVGTTAKFAAPTDVAVDAQGALFVTDRDNNCIRRISPAGEVTTIAGTRENGFANGPGSTAQFILPTGLGIDGQGNLYVAQPVGSYLRKVGKN
ncbi:NHL repeat-containing protein [Hymenobacter lucidus]|uniref:SMP-30/Gluconolactonase/LRE-like region domain-containing protein n=1 Tax=Hymenobacter lucidus TaxID=2880930 RepID=A0ABS8ARF8_9BACT|nr:NHL repeat-containing protein [Hymenobacter lucidus]MCB2408790.1 hypothetical protein [Hymenobacter lucidus]